MHELSAHFCALAKHIYAHALQLFNATELRTLGIQVDRAFLKDATMIWGIDSWVNPAPQKHQWEVEHFGVRSTEYTDMCVELWREKMAKVDVDTYEDLLIEAAGAARAGLVAAKLPVPIFLRLNFGGGCVKPLLDYPVIFAHPGEIYPIEPWI